MKDREKEGGKRNEGTEDLTSIWLEGGKGKK